MRQRTQKMQRGRQMPLSLGERVSFSHVAHAMVLVPSLARFHRDRHAKNRSAFPKKDRRSA